MLTSDTIKCIVCGYTQRPGSSQLSLFGFPTLLPLRQTWVNIVRGSVFGPIKPKFDRICEKHFNPKDIDRTGHETYLKPHSLPIITEKDLCINKTNSAQNGNAIILDYETVLDGIQQPASIPTRTNNLKPVPITHHFESPPAANISHFQDRENTSLDRNSTSYVLDEIQRPVSRPVRNKRPVTRNKGLCVPKTYQRAKTETILKAVKKRRVSRKKEIVVPKKPKEITAPRNTKEKRTETILQAVDDKLECLSRNMREDEFDTFGKHVANQLRQLPLLNAIMCQNYINGFLAEERMKILNCGGMLNMNASTSNINPNSSEMRRIEDVMLEETSNNPRDISLECIEEESKFIIDLSDTLSEQSRSHAETTVQRPNFGNS